MNKRPKSTRGIGAVSARIASIFKAKTTAGSRGILFFSLLQHPQEKLQIIYANIRV